jgi:hypothetical protein
MTTVTPRSVSLDSTLLATAAYDGCGQKLQLDLRDGTRYEYSGVAPGLYRDLLRATSKGSFFNRYIRGRFPYVKLRTEN